MSDESEQTDSDTTATMPSEEPTATTETAETDEQPEDARSRIERYVRYGALAGLSLLALVALLQFYFAVSNTIRVWVASEYRSLFMALFNLVVLLMAATGISWQLRALR